MVPLVRNTVVIVRDRTCVTVNTPVPGVRGNRMVECGKQT